MPTLSCRDPVRAAAEDAALLCAALALSYIESLLPLGALAVIPGAKLGLSHLAVLTAAHRGTMRDAAAVSLVRTVLCALLFGSVSSLFFSVSGAVCALLVLAVCRRFCTSLSYIGVSVLSAAAHNAGQLLCAVLVLHTGGLFLYFPVLLVFAALAGAAVGWIMNRVACRLPRRGAEKGAAYAP